MTHTPTPWNLEKGDSVRSPRRAEGEGDAMTRVRYSQTAVDALKDSYEELKEERNKLECKYHGLLAERDRLRAERDLLFNERIDTVNRLAETLKEAKDCIGRLVAACEQHHATSTCDSMALFAAANREYKQMDRIRAALAGKERP